MRFRSSQREAFGLPSLFGGWFDSCPSNRNVVHNLAPEHECSVDKTTQQGHSLGGGRIFSLWQCSSTVRGAIAAKTVGLHSQTACPQWQRAQTKDLVIGHGRRGLGANVPDGQAAIWISQHHGARISLTIDIGFGDALEPGAEMLDYPSMLAFSAPRLRAYARETVIAEKFQAMVALGRANSRMKDFYDIWILSKSFDFDGDRLARAIAATFARRETAIPVDLPDALTPAFANDEQKQRQWNTFVRDVSASPGSLEDVVGNLAEFLMPHATQARASNSSSNP